VAIAPAPAAAKPAVDLMAALKASVEAAKNRKGGAEKAKDEKPAKADTTKPSRRKKAAPAR
jgi:DNA end-binding protein Ku